MKMARNGALLCLVAAILVSMSRAAQVEEPESTDWQPLFDGETLDGWEMLEGKGNFFVKDGEIVGETEAGVKGSYLCTMETYNNFILELEFNVDEGLNSGVQIRTDIHKEDTATLYMSGRLELKPRNFVAGQVFGYQIEIDTSPRAWTGGLYEGGRRGWLQTLEYNEPARKAFKPGEWNKLRIQAVGDSIKTWLNGTSATDTRDAWCRTGRIGFQLHGTKESGKQLRFRNIRIHEID